MVCPPYGSWFCRTSPAATQHRRASPHTASHTYTLPETTSRTRARIFLSRLPWPAGSRERCSLAFPLRSRTAPERSTAPSYSKNTSLSLKLWQSVTEPNNAGPTFQQGWTYCSVRREFQTGAKVCQADVAVHVQQDVVRLDVPGSK